MDLDLGAFSDQVQTKIRDIPKELFNIFSELGSGYVGMSIIPYGGTVEGSLFVVVDAGSGHDFMDLNLNGVRQPYDIPVGSTFYITSWGDDPGAFAAQDNVADHGQDKIVVRWNGRVDGTLILRV